MRVKEIFEGARNWFQDDMLTDGLSEREQIAACALAECWQEDQGMTRADSIELLEKVY